mmetsp:Transcript_38664/g.93667  ORF Transcript_38664/g.93667 Transcript_38664/m.93667 type:complete len:522 (+) Transcript_38664:50-1615(+)
MNTASRMESTGTPGRIQVSNDTAELIRKAGKSIWLVPREDKVSVKGKGEMQTHFVQIGAATIRTTSSIGTTASGGRVYHTNDLNLMNTLSPMLDPEEQSAKKSRIEGWIVELMCSSLKEISANRLNNRIKFDASKTMDAVEKLTNKQGSRCGGDETLKTTSCPFDEVTEIITLPDYTDPSSHNRTAGTTTADDVVLSEDVVNELRDYIHTIALLYNSNAFHNFEHANHVVMSVSKLLSRIVTASPFAEAWSHESEDGHIDHTYGIITGDPLTRFAVVFSALIHDAGHEGVPNATLVKEQADVAVLYDNVSVAEQNSVELAWGLLMEPSYKNLRRQIYCNVSEYKRFRQLVVNAVMATDIIDKQLKELRNNRWDVAFNKSNKSNSADDDNRKATIVIEHIIQASDVAHTMQHWHIYRKWNEKFFVESYKAYLDGRAEKDPSVGWYEGEIGFFDFYIIPLAKKLKECGVFGVSSEEYLNYAIQNRTEWSTRGQYITENMVMKVRQHYNKEDGSSTAAVTNATP